ncbi:hypothetical protein GL50803_0016577 [Giardia duodenalis]|uniref:Uncharacterized protein n=1 Tax=Giardia intestinalis (strain ATCC 50803 / WB clone C6) TaxID=184922 RepID=A8BQT0_GIAIC|nr:hypothetical protein GL50803_0016577 [Giardia intestinalis]KAE8304951.1 hypothetical protein GL50803_0016577 [Giardia intestinalis]|eukprot:XP_001705480.1 Hypothetical protein GL50803_16577 [Giardia lamblia ATCC 50803]
MASIPRGEPRERGLPCDSLQRLAVTSAIEQTLLKRDPTDDLLQQKGEAQLRDCPLFVSWNSLFALWSVLIPCAVAFLFEGAMGFLEYTGVMAFGQLDGAYAFATYVPLLKVLFQSVELALMAAAANLLVYSFLRKFTGPAQMVFHYSIYFAIGWALLLGPLLGLFSKRISSNLDKDLSSFRPDHSIYLFLISIADPLTSLFSIFVSQFLILENRIILNASRHIFLMSFAEVFQIMSYFYIQAFNNNQQYLYDTHVIQDPKDIKYISPLTGTAVGSLLSQFIISVWIIFLFTDVTIFGISHEGVLRFNCCTRHRTASSRALEDRPQPKPAQILRKMFLFFPQNYLTYSYIPLSILLINCVMNATYDKENHQKILYNRLANLIYMRSYSIFSAVPVAIALSFRVVSMHTLRSGLYLKTKRLFIISLLHTIIIPPLLCIFGMLFARPMITMLTPKMGMLWGETASKEMVLMFPTLQKAFTAAALSPIITGPYHLILIICELEEKWLPSLLLSLGRTVVCIVSILCYGFILGDSVDFLPSVFFGDIFASIVGVLYAVYYWSKYTHLASIEQARAQLESLDEQLNRHIKEEHSCSESGESKSDSSKGVSARGNNRYGRANVDYGSAFDTSSNMTGETKEIDD